MRHNILAKQIEHLEDVLHNLNPSDAYYEDDKADLETRLDVRREDLADSEPEELWGRGDEPGDYDEDFPFADPGGESALRLATADNPRNLPCPTCGCPDRLTPEDRRRGYQCDSCARDQERGY